MKYTKLSLVTSSVIVGMALLSGCGSDSESTSNVGTTSGTAVKGYLKNSRVWADYNENGSKDDGEETNTTNGKFSFNKIPAVGKVIKVKVEGGVDSGDGKAFKGSLKGLLQSDGNVVVSPITTVMTAMYEQNTSAGIDTIKTKAAKALGLTTTELVQDPAATGNVKILKKSLDIGKKVEMMASGDATNYSKIVNAIAESLNEDVNISEATKPTKIKAKDTTLTTVITLTDDNIKALEDLIEDINETATVENIESTTTALVTIVKDKNITSSNTVNVNKIVDAIKELRDNLDVNSTINIDTFANSIKDGNLTADINTTNLSNVTVNKDEYEQNQTTIAEEAVNNSPAELSFGNYINIGAEKVELEGNVFTHTINTYDKNISDFYNISLPSVGIDKGFVDQNLTLKVTISDKNETTNMVSLYLYSAKLQASDDNKSVKIMIPSGTSIAVSQTGLPTLNNIIGSGATASTGSELTNSDLSFNLNTILSTIGSTQIPNAISALDTYLSTPRTYDVNITVNGFSSVIVPFNTITGTVTVTHEGTTSSSSSSTSIETPPTTPDISSSSSSSVVSSSSSSVVSSSSSSSVASSSSSSVASSSSSSVTSSSSSSVDSGQSAGTGEF